MHMRRPAGEWRRVIASRQSDSSSQLRCSPPAAIGWRQRTTAWAAATSCSRRACEAVRVRGGREDASASASASVVGAAAAVAAGRGWRASPWSRLALLLLRATWLRLCGHARKLQQRQLHRHQQHQPQLQRCDCCCCDAAAWQWEWLNEKGERRENAQSKKSAGMLLARFLIAPIARKDLRS